MPVAQSESAGEPPGESASGAGLRGIHPMQYAFFAPDGRLDRDAMRRQLEACVVAGAHGITILGLATEIGKLDDAERRQLLAWTAEDLGQRLPLGVTINGASVADQIAMVKAAEDSGAAWVILQPPTGSSGPSGSGISEGELVRFFGAVADSTHLPVAVQNAPQYIGIGLSTEGLNALRRAHANFTLLKGEAPAIEMREVVSQTEGALTIFNGRAGMELPDVLRAGVDGMIPSVDTVDRLVQVYEAMCAADEPAAEAGYREVLPTIVFVMQSVDTLVCYGKRIAAARLGIEAVHDRAPGLTPSAFGLDCVRRYASHLGPLSMAVS